MNKEEVLKRSRKSGIDEMQKDIEKVSNVYGLKIILLLAIIFLIYKKLHNIPYADMTAIIFAQISVAGFYKYSKLKDKLFLIAGVLGGVASALYTIGYMIG